MAQLSPGDSAPDFSLEDQNGNTVNLADFKGKTLLLYFYPKANTSGCTTQATAVSEALPDLSGQNVAAVGVSPDNPAQQKKFDDKHGLGFPLLSDPENAVSQAYGAYGEKKMYGKTYMGVIRSAFLIDGDGKIRNAWYKITPKNTVPEVRKALEG